MRGEQLLRFVRVIALAPFSVAFVSCGGGSSAPPSYYTIGGTVHGLAGSGLILQDNGGDALAVATNGSFKFETAVVSGHSYVVTVAAPPSNPSQDCVVSSGAGVVTNGAVTDVAVNCANSYAVGGTVTGLSGSGLVLADNGTDQFTVKAQGPFAFTFSTKLPSGSDYHVTVVSQPTNPIQNCMVQNGSRDGTVTDRDVTSLSVVCAEVGKFAYFSYFQQCANYIAASDPNCLLDMVSGTHVDPYAIDPSSGALNVGSLMGATVDFLHGKDLILSTDGGSIIENLTDYNIAPPGENPGLVQFAIAQAGSSLPPGSLSAPTSIDFNFFASLCYAPFASPNFFGSQFNGFITDLQGVSPIGVELATVAAQPAGTAPTLACDPLGRFVYSIYESTGRVSLYTIAAPVGGATTGTLSIAPGSPFVVGQTLTAIGTEPFGKFVFIANSNGSVKPASETISTLAIKGSALATASIIATLAGNDLAQIIVDPSGTFLYAPNGLNNIEAFAINPVSGQLSSIPGSPFSVGKVAVGTNTLARIAFDPSGKFLFVGQHVGAAETGQKVLITVYQMDANSGVLTPTTAPQVTFEMAEEDLYLKSIAVSK